MIAQSIVMFLLVLFPQIVMWPLQMAATAPNFATTS